MVSFSVSSMFFHEYTVNEIFSFVSQSGLNGIEFWLETPHFWLRDLPADEVIACRHAHPEISTFTVHSPILDLNPCSINPDVARVSVEHAVRSIAIAEQMGAHILTVHPGRRTAKRPPSSARLCPVRSLRFPAPGSCNPEFDKNRYGKYGTDCQFTSLHAGTDAGTP